MAPEHNACLSTSVPNPRRALGHAQERRGKPDYFLSACYALVYLELAWLIFVLLRSFSRD